MSHYLQAVMLTLIHLNSRHTNGTVVIKSHILAGIWHVSVVGRSFLGARGA